MKINKVRDIVQKKIKLYSTFNTIINNLEENKLTSDSRDINSFIKSKNKNSNIVEVQAIKNISIDNQIKEIEEWRKVIDFVFEEIKEENNHTKLEALQYKYLCKIPESSILEMLPISKGTLRNYMLEFITEIGIIAIYRGIIKMEKF